MRSVKRCTFLLVVLFALASVPAFAADLVTVSTHVSRPIANPGGSNSGEVLISNNTTADVRVRLDLQVIYSDGTIQPLSGITDPGTLAPGGGYVLNIHFIIPATAPVGVASFVANVSASSGGLQEQETQSADFLIIP